MGEALCSANYQGKVIFIIDRTTSDESSIENAIRQEYYINGTQKKVKFEWITVGENTAGKLAYANNAKWNYSVGELNFSPLPVNKNEWTTLEEGVGYLPEFWAVGEDDINKTIEYLTGETDFAELIKPVTQWRNYLCSSGEKALWNWSFKLPDSIKKIKSYDEYNKTVTELLKINIEYNSLINENREILNHFDWYFEMPDCATKTTKKVEDFTVPYKKVMALKIKWIQYLLENSEIFEKSNYWFEYPKVFTDCKSFSVYADCFEKWLNSRFAWCDLYVNNFEAMNRNATWWAFPDFFKSFKTAEQYCDYFCRWLDLRIWWCEVIINNEYVFHHNNIPIWYDALKEEIKEWKDPEKHLAELTAYLKNLKPWIEYLQPHPYVIPKDRGIANLYSTIRRTSEKIGKNCNAVPEEITKLQKTDPETYVDKMVAYINEFAENIDNVTKYTKYLKDCVVSIITHFKNIELFENAKEIHPEYKFMCGGVINDVQALLSGSIDLFLLNKDGSATIIDYKSDIAGYTTIEEFMTCIEEHSEKVGRKFDIIFIDNVDSLKILKGERGQDETAKMNSFITKLDAFSKTYMDGYGTCIVLLSQTNREGLKKLRAMEANGSQEISIDFTVIQQYSALYERATIVLVLYSSAVMRANNQLKLMPVKLRGKALPRQPITLTTKWEYGYVGGSYVPPTVTTQDLTSLLDPEYNDEEDIFVHYSAILTPGYKTLVEGQYVKFDLVRTDKGLQAKNVVEIKEAYV